MEEEVIDSTVEDVAQPEVVEQAEEPKSMDDTIRETLENIQARDDGRERDEKGRFVPKEAKEPEPETVDEQPTEQATPAAEAPTVPPELQRLGLRKEEAEAFAQAPKVLQDAFLRRSDEMHKGFEQVRQKAQFADQMAQAIQPYAQTLQQTGMHPAAAVQNLMAADHALRYSPPEQKVQLLAKIARDYGVDLNQLGYQTEQQPVDPNVHALQTQLQQMQAWIQQQNQAREWQERQVLNSTIQSFASDPAHVHFEAVRDYMAGLLQSGLAKDLKDAYEQAVNANPTIRAQLQAKQLEEMEAKRKAEAAQKAQAAKKAASVNLPRRGLVPSSKPVGTMDDTIRETAQRLGIM